LQQKFEEEKSEALGDDIKAQIAAEKESEI